MKRKHTSIDTNACRHIKLFESLPPENRIAGLNYECRILNRRQVTALVGLDGTVNPKVEIPFEVRFA
jgi:hypothetical protein